MKGEGIKSISSFLPWAFQWRLSLCIAFAAVFSIAAGRAQCEIQITDAEPCLADSTPGIPHVGDFYGVRVTANVAGTTAPFRIKCTIANVTVYSDYFTLDPGEGYWWYFVLPLDLDDSIPWSITLDPDGVSGDTNAANNTASGTFTPIPPASAVELYSPRLMHASESYTLNFEPGSGTIPNLYVLFSEPTTHGAQQVIHVSPPPSSHTVVTAPYGMPVFEIARTNVAAGVFQDADTFTVRLNRIRVNPDILRTVTWSDLSQMTTNWTQWLAPDPRNESTSPEVTNFVEQSLPADYRATMTPYDAARTLHRAVMKRLTYQSPPLHVDAVGVLQDGVADCGGFASLLTSSLRLVGIPARCISGFRQDNTVWHVRVEFHLPGVEWLVADPTDGNSEDPTGTFAYDFGYVPNADSFVAVDACDLHSMPYGDFEFIQTPNWFWSGGANFNSYDSAASLQPNGVLNATNGPDGSYHFWMTDTPTEGSVVMETSTNLSDWTAFATNSAVGSALEYFYPKTPGIARFFRAQLAP